MIFNVNNGFLIQPFRVYQNIIQNVREHSGNKYIIMIYAESDMAQTQGENIDTLLHTISCSSFTNAPSSCLLLG